MIPLTLFGSEKEVKKISDHIMPMDFEGAKGFWVSSWLLNEYNLVNEYHTFTWGYLGMNETNYEKRLKGYRKLSYVNKVLIGIIVGGFLMWLGCLCGLVVYVCLAVSDKGITFQERY